MRQCIKMWSIDFFKVILELYLVLVYLDNRTGIIVVQFIHYETCKKAYIDFYHYFNTDLNKLSYIFHWTQVFHRDALIRATGFYFLNRILDCEKSVISKALDNLYFQDNI